MSEDPVAGSSIVKVHRCGRDAALVELSGLDEVLGLHAALRAEAASWLVELVPAARTLLVRFDPHVTTMDRVVDHVAALEYSTVDSQGMEEVVVPVRYDGADLADVASCAGMTEAEVIERHTGARYTVAFCGFAPGFGYLTGLDRELWLPRRETPRTKVPAGSVALADQYAGVYPRSSPGGWHILGSTDLPVWDADRDPPALLVPGTPVRFEVVR
ncbi:5-oxoprolinase subunit B family protein [Allokutzneria albata]|uniref:Sensor histidine kinase inhibitor, KipI family n=1 Tax=Allokutzneria albata TaxID=211114 RepID=A0A1G9WH40_ALLAB|nr:allophanate hydrolase subunit 1 [Allokutzneria albata]SDM83769.1 sensor histidine kinase inhibitor, KipI family [Allokutzneria albata]